MVGHKCGSNTQHTNNLRAKCFSKQFPNDFKITVTRDQMRTMQEHAIAKEILNCYLSLCINR